MSDELTLTVETRTDTPVNRGGGLEPAILCFVSMRKGNRTMRVPAQVQTWEDPSTGGLHLMVNQMDYMHAEWVID